jgi:DNA-directed RNA polymerase subunit RPC12/RpoP
MTTKNPTGYCPNCQERVLLTRKDIDWCLAIILLIFTAGIGFVIYLIYYYSQSEDRCIHCGTIIHERIQSPYSKRTEELEYQNTPEEFRYERREIRQVQEVETTATKFCPFCGEKLKGGARFCANCGSKL